MNIKKLLWGSCAVLSVIGSAYFVTMPDAHAQMNNPGAPGNVVAGNNLSQSGNIIGIAAPVTVANGGTGATSAGGTALDNVSGFSGTGFVTRTGAGAYSFQSLTNGITLGNIAQIGANTMLGNATGSTGNISAVSMVGCNGATQASQWTNGSGWGCNSAIIASNVNGTVAVANGGTGASNSTGATSNLQYLQGATGSAARSLTNKFQDSISTGDFSGCDPTGTTDSTVCLQNAINAAANKNLYVAPGNYKVTALTISSPITLLGGGSGAVTLTETAATGDTITVSTNNVLIQGFTFTSSVTRTSGSFVNFTSSSQIVTLRDFYMTNYFLGVHMTASAKGRVQFGTMLGSNNAAFSAGILVDGGNDQYIDQVTMDATTQPAAGIQVTQTGALNITDCDIVHHTNDLLINPGEGQSVASLWVVDSYFDTATKGILINPTSNGIVQRLRFMGSWSSSHSSQGILIKADGTSVIDGVEFIGQHALLNTAAGAEIAASSGTVRNIRFTAGAFVKNGAQGILFDAGVSEFSVIGARVGSGFDNSNTGNATGGIVVAAGASNNFTLLGNDVRGNTGAGISDSSTGASKIIANNLGYNPPAETTASVGASPWTYTNNSGSAQTLYINGGTVSLVSVGGSNVFQQTNCTIRVLPGVSATITYSVAPGVGITTD